MFGRLFRANREAERIATGLYGAIVAQARSAALYADLGVPDTPAGRFEMVVLHTVLVVERLRAGEESARALGQEVFDLFCADMDGALREMGLGDLAVPRHMKRVAGAFYGRAEAYRRGLAAGDAGDLARALAGTVLGDGDCDCGALARYAVSAAAALAELPTTALLSLPPGFLNPGPFAGVGAGP